MNKNTEDRKRIVAYVDKKDYREARAKLALKGETFSSWIRKQIDKLNGKN